MSNKHVEGNPPTSQREKIERGVRAAESLADSGSFFQFGKFKCKGTQAFFISQFCTAFVNLRPIIPGHVLLCTTRVVERYEDLTDEEVFDLWRTARDLCATLCQDRQREGLNLAVQDGAAAGQTVPHVHVHIIPRKAGDLERNDMIYERLEECDVSQLRSEQELEEPAAKARKLEIPPDSERKNRTEQDMAAEAKQLRDTLLRKWCAPQQMPSS